MDDVDRKRIEASKRTLYATDFHADNLSQIIDGLRAADGVRYDCAILDWKSCQTLVAELDGAVRLTREEARAAYNLIDELSGFNASNVFARDGTDDQSDPTTSAMAKVFSACGKRVPKAKREGE